MRRDDYFLLITSGLLNLSGHKLTAALNYFGRSYEMEVPGKGGSISLAGMSRDGRVVGLSEWIRRLRERSIQKIQCSRASYHNDGALEPHVAAAFAGSQLLTLALTLQGQTEIYAMKLLFSPQHEMTPVQFADVINAQQGKEELWRRISDLVQHHNQLNKKPSFDSKRIAWYLTNEGQSEFDFLSSQLIREVQVECHVLGQPFVVPESLKHLFFRSDLIPITSRHRAVFLYTLKEPSIRELTAIVDAHPFKEQVWKRFVTQLSEHPITGFPAFTADQWPLQYEGLPAEQRSIAANLVCRAICSLCEERNMDRIIPDHLNDIFGPDELENKRAQARGQNGDRQWYLVQNKNPWELYLFERTAGLILEDGTPLIAAREKFIAALEAIHSYAQEIKSPFDEAFGLALFFLTEQNRSGFFDESSIAGMLKRLEALRFSDQAIDRFNSIVSYATDMKMLEFSPGKMYDLMAVSAADVFGGMGSWNDQYSMDHRETFDKHSSALFESLKQFFSGALSQDSGN